MLSCPVFGPIIVPPKLSVKGGRVVCSGCTGKFLLLASGDSFEAEWLGSKDGARVLEPDIDTVEEAVSRTPARLEISAAHTVVAVFADGNA